MISAGSSTHNKGTLKRYSTKTMDFKEFLLNSYLQDLDNLAVAAHKMTITHIEMQKLGARINYEKLDAGDNGLLQEAYWLAVTKYERATVIHARLSDKAATTHELLTGE